MHLRYVYPNRRLSKVEGSKTIKICVSFIENLAVSGKKDK